MVVFSNEVVTLSVPTVLPVTISVRVTTLFCDVLPIQCVFNGATSAFQAAINAFQLSEPWSSLYTIALVGSFVVSKKLSTNGTTFNVPLYAGSEHDVYYEGQVRFVNASEIVLGIYKNGSIQGFLKKIKSGANTVIPFSFSASDLMLIPGDTIDVRGVKISTGAELEYCTIKIVKR